MVAEPNGITFDAEGNLFGTTSIGGPNGQLGGIALGGNA